MSAKDNATLGHYEAVANEFEAVANRITQQHEPDTMLASQLRELAAQIRQGTSWMKAA